MQEEGKSPKGRNLDIIVKHWHLVRGINSTNVGGCVRPQGWRGTTKQSALSLMILSWSYGHTLWVVTENIFN